jgi:hypothetical protein
MRKIFAHCYLSKQARFDLKKVKLDMCKWKQELKELANKHRQHKKNIVLKIKEQLNSFCGKQYFENIVMPAFQEIKTVLEDNGSHVCIESEANYAWITIGNADMESGKKEDTKELKYEITISGQMMGSRLYLLMSFGPQKEWPIGDENELAGDLKGNSIADITSEDIREDFIAAYGAYLNGE